MDKIVIFRLPSAFVLRNRKTFWLFNLLKIEGTRKKPGPQKPLSARPLSSSAPASSGQEQHSVHIHFQCSVIIFLLVDDGQEGERTASSSARRRTMAE